jgi:hypothetical protein
MVTMGGFAPGVTSFPIDRIRHAVHPTGDALVALDELADASSKASTALSASCPSEPPLTPLARLDAVEARLEAMRKAIQIVQPPLASLYDSLSDEQRQRFDTVGAEENRHKHATAAADSSGFARVEVQPDQLLIHLAEAAKTKASCENPSTLHVPWQKTPARRRREIILPEGIQPEHARPMP